MKKIVKLTESELMNIVKSVIKEENNIIKISQRYGHVINEVGTEASPEDIINMWNEYVRPDTLNTSPMLVSYENKKFINEEGESFPVNVILEEINNSLYGEEESYSYEKRPKMGPKGSVEITSNHILYEKNGEIRFEWRELMGGGGLKIISNDTIQKLKQLINKVS